MRDSEKALLEIVKSIYAAVEGPENWSAVIEGLAVVLGATAGTLNFYNFRSHHGEVAAAFKIDPEFGLSYRECFAPKDIWINSPRAKEALGQVVPGQMLVSDEQLIRSEFYQEFLRPQNIFHLIGSRVQDQGDSTAVLSLFRPKNKAPFGAGEITVLDCLLPHILRAVQIFFRLHKIYALNMAVGDVLEQLPFGVILVTASGKPLLVNRKAAEIAAARDGLILHAERVEASLLRESALMRSLISEASASCSCLTIRPGGTLFLTRPSFKPSLIVLVAPISRVTALLDEQGADAVIFVTDPTMTRSLIPEAVASFFKLTPAETKLCGLLASGNSIEKSSRKLGVSLNTVRTHLKHVFDKTGTHRQSELVLLLTQKMPGIQ